LCCAIAPRNASRASCALFKTQHVVSTHKRRRSINRKHWFFCRAVVIRMQCSRSPRTLLRLRHSLRLGGQHGEEAKDEDEVSGEKGRKEDQAPEEEVTRAASQSSTSNDVDDCVTRAGASRGAVSASRSHFDTAGPDRRQRASARQGFELHCSISAVMRVLDALWLRGEGEEEGRKISGPRRGRGFCPRSRTPASHRRPRCVWMLGIGLRAATHMAWQAPSRSLRRPRPDQGTGFGSAKGRSAVCPWRRY
jgi:hypothetical protein